MDIVRLVKGILFPDQCRLCGEVSCRSGDLCVGCMEVFARESNEVCPICGEHVGKCVCGTDFSAHTSEIGSSRYAALTFYKSRTAYPDSDRITERMIFAMKSAGGYTGFFACELASLLRRMFSENVTDINEYRVTFIPRTEARLRTQGIDQSEELASMLAKEIHLPFDRIFSRSQGSEQKSLGVRQRTENMEKSLYISGQVKKDGKYLLVDDIITSGASMTAAARLLRFEGALEVFPTAAARTMMPPCREIYKIKE